MMLGFERSVADQVLDALCRGGTFTGPTNLYLQLHTGEPGVVGTENVAFNDSRQSVAFTVSSSGMNVSNVDVKWFNVRGQETFTHFSVWDDPTAGKFLFSGTMSETYVEPGYNVTIPAGSELSLLKVAT